MDTVTWTWHQSRTVKTLLLQVPPVTPPPAPPADPALSDHLGQGGLPPRDDAKVRGKFGGLTLRCSEEERANPRLFGHRVRQQMAEHLGLPVLDVSLKDALSSRYLLT